MYHDPTNGPSDPNARVAINDLYRRIHYGAIADHTLITKPFDGLYVWDQATDSFWLYTDAGGWTSLGAGGEPLLTAHIADATDAHDASAISIVDSAADFAATDVEGALAELQTADEADEAALAAHLADTVDAHDASAISAVSTTLVGTATDVQGVLEELDNGIADHLADTTDAHAASAITNTPAGSVAATTVQGAINELATDYAAADSSVASTAASALSSHEADTTSIHGIADTAVLATASSVTTAINSAAGDGLAGSGGVLSVNTDNATIEKNADTLRVKAGGIGANELASTAATPGTYGSASYTPVITVDADGRITASSHVASTPAAVGVQATMTEGPNLLTNPGAETNTTGWTASNATLTRDTGTKRTGAASFKMSTTSSTVRTYMGTATGTSGMAVTEAATYAMRAFYVRGTLAIDKYAEYAVLWYDSGGTIIGSETVYANYAQYHAAWTSQVLFFTAPALAAYAAIRIGLSSTDSTAGQTFFIDDLYFGRISQIQGTLQTSSTGPSIDAGAVSGYPQLTLKSGRDDVAYDASLWALYSPATLAQELTIRAPYLTGQTGTIPYINIASAATLSTMNLAANRLDLTYIGRIIGTPRTGGTWSRVANQVIATSTLTPISWDTETFDSDTQLAHHATTGTTWTCAVDGLYNIVVGGTYGVTIATRAFYQTVAAGRTYFQEHTTEQGATLSIATIPLVVGNTVVTSVWQQSGSNKNFTGYFDIYRMAP